MTVYDIRIWADRGTLCFLFLRPARPSESGAYDIPCNWMLVVKYSECSMVINTCFASITWVMPLHTACLGMQMHPPSASVLVFAQLGGFGMTLRVRVDVEELTRLCLSFLQSPKLVRCSKEIHAALEYHLFLSCFCQPLHAQDHRPVHILSHTLSQPSLKCVWRSQALLCTSFATQRFSPV